MIFNYIVVNTVFVLYNRYLWYVFSVLTLLRMAFSLKKYDSVYGYYMSLYDLIVEFLIAVIWFLSVKWQIFLDKKIQSILSYQRVVYNIIYFYFR